MTEILDIFCPEQLGIELCGNWTELSDLVRLDTAICNQAYRIDLLRLFKMECFQTNLDIGNQKYNCCVYHWLSYKSLSTSSCSTFGNCFDFNDVMRYLDRKVFSFASKLNLQQVNMTPVTFGLIESLSVTFSALIELEIESCILPSMEVPSVCKINPLLNLRILRTSFVSGGDLLLAQLVWGATRIQTVSFGLTYGGGRDDGSLYQSFIATLTEFSCANLTAISFCGIRLHAKSLENISKCSKLSKLNFSKLKGDDECLSLGNVALSCPLVQDLVIMIPHNEETQNILLVLKDFVGLTILDLSGSKGVDDEFLIFIAQHCTKMVRIIASNIMPGVTSHGIVRMLQIGFNNLTDLILNDNRIECGEQSGEELQGSTFANQSLQSLSLVDTAIDFTDLCIVLKHGRHITHLDYMKQTFWSTDGHYDKLLHLCPNIKTPCCKC
jgi:hypothetical protein